MGADTVDFSAVRRVLITKLRHHGDVLITSPVFSALKAHAPHLEIDALVYRETAPMLANHPSISRIFTIDRQWKKQGVLAQGRDEWKLLSELRERQYDLLVHLTEHWRGAWLKRLLRIRHAVAPQRPGVSPWWKRSFTHLYALPRGTMRHMVEVNLDALRKIGVFPYGDVKRLVLVPGADAEARVDAMLREHGLAPRSFIQLHPGSRWLFKCWPSDRVAELTRRLVGEGERIVMTGAPDPVELSMVERILSEVPSGVVNLAGTLTLPELAALTARARGFIGVDSAPMHIASAMGTPAIALFGPSGEIRWRPWMVVHRVVASDVHPCRPCGNDGCGGSKVSDCLTTLPVDRVHAALREVVPPPISG
jgi:heptosyltransferase-3